MNQFDAGDGLEPPARRTPPNPPNPRNPWLALCVAAALVALVLWLSACSDRGFLPA